jgi:hypothetical protein
MRLFLLLAVLMTIAMPASAQDMLKDAREADPAENILGDKKDPEDINDYATKYYQSCVAANQTDNLKEYVETQCGCTSAEMTKFMTLKDMQNLFKKTKEGDFQQSRVILLAY